MPIDPRDWLIPDSGSARAWLADRLGADGWAEFCQRFGGQRLRVPVDGAKPARNRAICDRVRYLHDWCGMSCLAAAEQAASEFHLSAKAVEGIVHHGDRP